MNYFFNNFLHDYGLSAGRLLISGSKFRSSEIYSLSPGSLHYIDKFFNFFYVVIYELILNYKKFIIILF